MVPPHSTIFINCGCMNVGVTLLSYFLSAHENAWRELQNSTGGWNAAKCPHPTKHAKSCRYSSTSQHRHTEDSSKFCICRPFPWKEHGYSDVPMKPLGCDWKPHRNQRFPQQRHWQDHEQELRLHLADFFRLTSSSQFAMFLAPWIDCIEIFAHLRIHHKLLRSKWDQHLFTPSSPKSFFPTWVVSELLPFARSSQGASIFKWKSAIESGWNLPPCVSSCVPANSCVYQCYALIRTVSLLRFVLPDFSLFRPFGLNNSNLSEENKCIAMWTLEFRLSSHRSHTERSKANKLRHKENETNAN